MGCERVKRERVGCVRGESVGCERKRVGCKRGREWDGREWGERERVGEIKSGV